MKTAAIISCVAPKRSGRHQAKDLYDSSYFCLCLAAARDIVDNDDSAIWILSAKYGLVNAEEMIEDYDITLGDEGAIEDLQASIICSGLLECDDVYVLAPNTYWDLIHKTCEPLNWWPQRVFEGTRGIGDQRGASKSICHVFSERIER